MSKYWKEIFIFLNVLMLTAHGCKQGCLDVLSLSLIAITAFTISIALEKSGV